MVCVAGLAAANEAGVLRHKSKMLSVSPSLRLRKGQHAFVDGATDVIVCHRSSPVCPVRLARGPPPVRAGGGEPVLECQSDPFAVRERQGVCLWPLAERPAIQIVVTQPRDLDQQLVPQV